MVGETIHHYKILEQIGQGGMGVVYRFEGDHVPRSNEIVRVTLDWLDRYLGAPR